MRKLFTYIGLVALLFATPILSGCTESEDTDTSAVLSDTADTAGTTAMQDGEEQEAVARLEPTEGNDVRGTVTFTQTDGAVRVSADITGLTQGPHGIHVHEVGDCSAPDATSAGGHFGPGGSPHGAPDSPPDQRHVGDLGNLEASSDGSASFQRVDSLLAFQGQNNIVGRAVIVHAGEDDLTSQPSGNAGARVACGVIELGNGMAMDGAQGGAQGGAQNGAPITE